MWRRRPCQHLNDTAGPVAEAAENDVPVSADDVEVTDTKGGAAVPANTCCGLELRAGDIHGPYLKFWGLEPQQTSSEPFKPTIQLPDPADPRFLNQKLRLNSSVAAAAPKKGNQRIWLGSILMVTKAPSLDVVVTVQDQGSPNPVILDGEILEEYGGWTATRFRIRLPVGQEEKKVTYTVTVSGKEVTPPGGGHYSFYIAGMNQPAHWGYYSCSGFCDVSAKKMVRKWGGLKPLWEDVKAVHAKNPLHVLVGGGDQLYNDDVWTLPSLQPFLDMRAKHQAEREARKQTPFTAAMEEQVDAYYFHHYCAHFSSEVVGDVYANVPQIMSWDDHDIFDGWGSYPDYLQDSVVFRGIFKSANRWYCIFQQHCKPEEKEAITVYEVGGRTAIVTADQRHRRLRAQIMPLEHYMQLTNLCSGLPEGVEHVVFVFTVPVVYPHVRGAQKVLRAVNNHFMRKMMRAFGVGLFNKFGEPELMDDLDDHWTARSHHDERRFLIEHLQMLAKYRGCRVTLVSGDVHVCGAGYLISRPRPPKEQRKHDFRYMVQIVSSAIVNAPPPKGLMRLLDLFTKGGKINMTTKHNMFRIIGAHMGRVGQPLSNKRNWCRVVEHMPSGPDSLRAGGLTFNLRIEEDDGMGPVGLRELPVFVPPLEPLLPGTDEYFDIHSVKLVRRVCGCGAGGPQASSYGAAAPDAPL
ncbi:hypothetical protein HYH03_002589 [Edaphochlamys debaryana]|uniref:PhoD-like phosphatase domain-containing protein n=1 Tax=Edaphochlamys debaryana TaxID=47281 RepID=A0A835YBM7_9CHLO|nr:hypothetical protein HYH03_002589 [Edaphochlamys debaryana]|eukprot:KAG2499651.1 hypothetical protein HYH03_002589 [Edaphochlamys debaryana]